MECSTCPLCSGLRLWGGRVRLGGWRRHGLVTVRGASANDGIGRPHPNPRNLVNGVSNELD